MDYGTGAVMGVPAHDQRDFEFAKKYKIDVKVVITPNDHEIEAHNLESAYVDQGVMINSDQFNGVPSSTTKQSIADFCISKNIAKKTYQYKLRDWLISRQRYWGTPIPMMYNKNNEPSPIPLSELPVKLPEDIAFTGKGNPLSQSKSFMSLTVDNKEFRRETDTMDTFFDSSWYFLRYCDPKNKSIPFSQDAVNNWLPVDQYIGGIEHACLHLLYARFFTKVLRDLGLCDVNEPFKRLLCQGMVLKDGAKMSKSLGNTVEPDTISNKYGVDTARIFILFGAPVDRDLDWSDKAVEGAFRFLKRVFTMVNEYENYSPKDTNELAKVTHKTIKKVTDDIQRFSFNTAISKLMELLNYFYTNGTTKESIDVFLLLMAPFAPFITEELWQQIGHNSSIHLENYPVHDSNLIVDDKVTIVAQVNGKVRDKFLVNTDASQDEVEIEIFSSEKVKKHTENKEIIKKIYVPNKLINLVVR